MYKLHIQNETVRQNVDTVMENLRAIDSQKEERKKIIPLALHRETGVLENVPVHLKRNFVLVQLHLDLDKHDVYITGPKEAVFELKKLNKMSAHIMDETFHLLKQALRHIHDLRELSHLPLDPSMDVIKGRSILHEAWHALGREDAERVLLGMPPGTYLFRKDVFAKGLEMILTGAKKMRIRCFTLTYVDQKGQVRDRTVIHWNERWLFYDDDPTLSGDYYLSLEELLQSMKAALKRPLAGVVKRPG